jgi:hypothetical protein
MTEVEPSGAGAATVARLAMLAEIFEAAIDVAGDVWPTPSMALGRLFERGAAFLSERSSPAPIAGTASAELLDALNVTREDLLLVEALYLLTRHVTFVVTEEGAALEKTWLALADQHLAIRADIVDRRREEEELKRQLAALGGATVPLPEHDDLPAADGERPHRRAGLYEHLFDGVSVVEADFDVDPAVQAAADRVAVGRGWDREWGEHARLLVLTHGVSLALREREADAVDADDDGSVKAAQDAARARLVALDGRYSSLRRRLFELRHNNRILRWRITALEVEAVGMRNRLDLFLADRDRLEQAIQAHRAAGAVPRQPGSDDGLGGWRRRLGRLFGRRA